MGAVKNSILGIESLGRLQKQMEITSMLIGSIVNDLCGGISGGTNPTF